MPVAHFYITLNFGRWHGNFLAINIDVAYAINVLWLSTTSAKELYNLNEGRDMDYQQHS